MAGDAPHVLVVDDAPELRAFFRDALEGEGYRVTIVPAAPGLDEVARLAPDCVLLDLLLGTDEAAAWGFAQALRRDERLAVLPIVVCSAATHLLRRLERPLAALGIEVVPKPFELDVFFAAVERCIAGQADPICPPEVLPSP